MDLYATKLHRFPSATKRNHNFRMLVEQVYSHDKGNDGTIHWIKLSVVFNAIQARPSLVNINYFQLFGRCTDFYDADCEKSQSQNSRISSDETDPVSNRASISNPPMVALGFVRPKNLLDELPPYLRAWMYDYNWLTSSYMWLQRLFKQSEICIFFSFYFNSSNLHSITFKELFIQ